MKTIRLNGTYTVTANLSNHPIKLDDETVKELKELQDKEKWDALDFAILSIIDGNFDLSWADGEFEGDDLIDFGEKDLPTKEDK
jgi:hypothetical protein